MCYGRDLSSGNLVNIGEAVGTVAAQSIGEPGTQLTMRTFHIGGVAVHKGAKILIKSKHSGEVVLGEGMEIKEVEDESGHKVKMVTRSGNLILKIKDKKEEYLMPVGAVLKVKEGHAIKTGEPLAEYDSTYDYTISSSPGRVKFINLEALHRKRRSGHKTIDEYIAKKDGEIFVYNPRVKKEYGISSGIKVFIKLGDKVSAGDEIASGVVSSAAGVVIETKRSEIVVAPGESYLIVAGSRLLTTEGAEVGAYEVLAKVESIRRDPSKTRDIIQGLPKVESLFEARRPKDPALLSETEGVVAISEREGARLITVSSAKGEKKEFLVPYEVRLRVAHGDRVHKGDVLTEGTINPHDILRIVGVRAVQQFLVSEIQKIYRSQGVAINDKHIEVIVRQMTRRVRIVKPGDTILLPGELIDMVPLTEMQEKTKGDPPQGEEVLLGITKASLTTESFISASSFQETARVLTEAAVKGKRDVMYGLKENVIIGRLIPAGTGFIDYQSLELVPTTGEKV
jgi:DNA-directed RNA polymerase subunit beta'